MIKYNFAAEPDQKIKNLRTQQLIHTKQQKIKINSRENKYDKSDVYRMKYKYMTILPPNPSRPPYSMLPYPTPFLTFIATNAQGRPRQIN